MKGNLTHVSHFTMRKLKSIWWTELWSSLSSSVTQLILEILTKEVALLRSRLSLAQRVFIFIWQPKCLTAKMSAFQQKQMCIYTAPWWSDWRKDEWRIYGHWAKQGLSSVVPFFEAGGHFPWDYYWLPKGKKSPTRSVVTGRSSPWGNAVMDCLLPSTFTSRISPQLPWQRQHHQNKSCMRSLEGLKRPRHLGWLDERIHQGEILSSDDTTSHWSRGWWLQL